jgi:hypothetical protein
MSNSYINILSPLSSKHVHIRPYSLLMKKKKQGTMAKQRRKQKQKEYQKEYQAKRKKEKYEENQKIQKYEVASALLILSHA